ncbi:MAG: EAL domain-containing protein [Rubrobacter sp.]|nr:EAL domain-containing protein [Rubrobacter sp.]MDQ3218708.1 EAL domain-containing protein [Actinomycetota bacterium]
MSVCSRCETLPTTPSKDGVLHVAPPLSHTRSTLCGLLRKSGLPFDELMDGILTVEVAPDDLQVLSRLIRGKLSEKEMRDSRALLVEKGIEPTIRELVLMQDLGTFTAAAEGEWLLEIMRDERLTSHFQPIVSASGDIFAHEALLRGLDVDGSLINPGRMFDTARSANLLFNLDRAARIKAIEEAADLGLENNIFINFNPTSIYDPVYCLRSTMKAVDIAGIPPERIVFEVVESDEIRDTKQLLDILAYYRDAGFRVALDDLGAGYGSLNLLSKLRPDFVKLDMDLIHGVDQDPYKATISSRIIELARDLKISIVAEGVETEGQWRWLREHGTDYAQGFFFARPASPPLVPAGGCSRKPVDRSFVFR